MAVSAQNTVEHQSALSDALLRQLIAVGQVDILVGLPTLNNAATIVDVVRAVHVCFTRDFPRLRTVLINSDGGSTDGTPELIRAASTSDADMVQTSHSLRTLHRVLAPYHGLPGKHAALRTVFAAGELTQTKALVVIDPGGPATTPERVSELIGPIVRAEVEFLAPRYRRHPRDGVLITQLVRPLVRALYGIALDEPLGAEFACSGTVRVALSRSGHLGSRGRDVRDRSVAPHRGGGGAIHRWSSLAPDDHGRGHADNAPRGRAPDRPVPCREPSGARVVLAEGQRHHATAHMGQRPGRDARRRGVGLPGARRRRLATT